MKCPKWMWIIHPGSLELGFLERIFCQRFLKSCLVTEITWALTQARNCKTHSLWAALWKLPRCGVPPSNTCDARAVMKLRVTLACGSSHGADKCWLASRRVNIPRQGSYERAAYQGGQTALTSRRASAPDPWRRTCLYCLKRLRRLSWRCCGSQMARSHRMRGWVSNIGNWRWDMIE